MSTHRLTLQLTVDYDLHGVDPDELKDNLTRLVDHAVGNGMLTGETDAEVETWDARVIDDTAVAASNVATSPDAIGRWLRTLDPGDQVYIDDGGLMLCVVDEAAYLEVGGYTPEAEKQPLSQETFVDYLESNCEPIKPEEAFREVCLMQDSEEWRRLERNRCNADPLYEAKCKLEIDDRPGFRQGLNDYADAMVKGRSWVTFDNGETYFTDEAIKEALQAFDESEYEYDPELRSIVDHWL